MKTLTDKQHKTLILLDRFGVLTRHSLATCAAWCDISVKFHHVMVRGLVKRGLVRWVIIYDDADGSFVSWVMYLTSAGRAALRGEG